MSVKKRSVCPHDCPSVCSLDIEVLDERTIGRVYGAKSHSYTSGVICAKVSRYAERVHHPDRITHPLKRIGKRGIGSSEYERITWDEALDTIAARFKDIIDTDGAQSIWPYHYAGTMGWVQRDGLDRLRHCLGTSRQHATFCITLADAGWKAGTGAKRGSDARLMNKSELVVIWGCNPVSTQVNVMHHFTQAKRESGAKLVVIDPYKTKTADKADMHLMLKPGTDAALACAVINVLLSEGLADRDYLAKHTDFNSSIEQHFASRTPAWAAQITGLSEQEIVEFARLYGSTRKSFLRIGYGFTRSRNGAANMHAVSCLPAITGAWLAEGGGALYSQSGLYGINKSLICAEDVPHAHTRVLDQSRIGAILCGDPSDLQGGPPVKALFIQNTNPAVVAPDTNKVLKGLGREDLFTVVHEQFMTDTARWADIVLPATMFLEHDDLYTAGGHTSVQFGPKLIEPPGECRSNHRVLIALFDRLGLSHPANELSERELIDATLRATGLPGIDELEKTGNLECGLTFDSSNFLDGFETHDKRFHFSPDWSLHGPNSKGMPEMPDYWDVIDQPNNAHPMRLVTAPARQFLNTSFTETPTSVRMEKQPFALLHPDDMQRYSLVHGEMVTLGNELGEVAIEAKQFEGVQPGTVVVESLWPNHHFVGGIGINALISSEPGKPNGGAVFHDTAVWVQATVHQEKAKAELMLADTH